MSYLHAVQALTKQLDTEEDHFDLIPPLLERVELKQGCMQLSLKLVAGTAPATVISADLPMEIKRRGVELMEVISSASSNSFTSRLAVLLCPPEKLQSH
jgi:hypothetical protein